MGRNRGERKDERRREGIEEKVKIRGEGKNIRRREG